MDADIAIRVPTSKQAALRDHKSGGHLVRFFYTMKPSTRAERRLAAVAVAVTAGAGRRTVAGAAAAVAAAAAAKTQEPRLAPPPRVLRVVLTGGPCGGKTTALPSIADALRARGIPTATVAETATSLVEGGIDRVAMIGTPGGLFEFNLQYQEMQMEKEDRMASLIRAAVQYSDTAAAAAAAAGGGGAVDAVLLCDRGTMDSKAHVPPAVWEELLGALGVVSDVEICEERYDAVLHFVTAADGAEEAYSTAGNAARTETVAEARESDRKLREVWSRHPQVTVLENPSVDEGGLEAKVERAVQLVLALAASTE